MYVVDLQNNNLGGNVDKVKYLTDYIKKFPNKLPYLTLNLSDINLRKNVENV